MRVFLPLSVAFISAATLHAATVVNWDGGVGGQTYQLGAPISQAFNGSALAADISYAGSAATDRQAIRPYSSSTAFSPITNYPNGVNASVYSTTFYGAYESIVLDAPGGTASNAQVVRTGTSASGPEGSVVSIRYARPAGSNFVGTNLLLFQKANFLNGGNAGAISLASLSLTTVNPSVTTGTASNMRGRWVIENGSTYYVSQTTFSLDANTYSLSDFSLSQWAIYTPSTAAGTVLNFQPSAFSTINFNDVQAVGFYAETWDGDQILAGTGAAAGNVIAGFNMTDFLVTTAPVPEPSAQLLLGAALAGLVVLRRSRKRGLS